MPSDARVAEPLARAFERDRRHVWGLCYRMTGSAADADDLVQDTFERALTRPPADLSRGLRPWLTKVALNLGRDALRRRQANSYVGPWLPAPIEIGDEPPCAEAWTEEGASTAGRYDLMESVSMAFLVALEALSPKQRAVLL
ncbi:MAG: sigma-70 family RNA polymerase sigma factor, partial [Myxococcales bacterium]|nr:sigma-70 family RNA polymerase sigma factor [Myxococcales bacterium]